MREDKYGAHPKSVEELRAYIEQKVAGPHDYNTSADALYEIAVAAFNCAAHLLGNSGFQAGYAALKFLGTVNGYDGPFGIVKAEDLLYPQYGSATAKVAKWQVEWAGWLAEQARERLEEHPKVVWKTVTDNDGQNPVDIPNVHPNVHAHWRKLAGVES